MSHSHTNGVQAPQAANPDELVIDDEEDATEAEKQEDLPHPDAETLIHPEISLAGTADTTADPNALDESVDVKANGLEAVNPDEITMEDDDEDEDPPHSGEDNAHSTLKEGNDSEAAPHAQDIAKGDSGRATYNTEANATRFLALSKCMPGQDFLQVG